MYHSIYYKTKKFQQKQEAFHNVHMYLYSVAPTIHIRKFHGYENN